MTAATPQTDSVDTSLVLALDPRPLHPTDPTETTRTIGFRSSVAAATAAGGAAERSAGDDDPTDDGESTTSARLVEDSEAHGVIVATSGLGKSVTLAQLIARWSSSTVVLDPKGELANITARAKRDAGHQVLIIDPEDITDTDVDPGSICPLELCRQFGLGVDALSMMIGELASFERADDPFWRLTGTSLLEAVFGYFLPRPGTGLDDVFEFMGADDLDMRIAVILDTEKNLDPDVRQRFIGYLELPEQNTRPSVKGTARAMLAPLSHAGVRASMRSTTIDLHAFVSGETPTSIYLVLPPRSVKSTAPAFRMLLAMLFQLLTSTQRDERPYDGDVLVVLDELATVGYLHIVPTMYSFLRSYGVRVFSSFQSIAQLEATYGGEAQVILDNSRVRMVFTANDSIQAAMTAPLVDATPDEVRTLPVGQIIVATTTGTYVGSLAPYFDTDLVPAHLVDQNPQRCTRRPTPRPQAPALAPAA